MRGARLRFVYEKQLIIVKDNIKKLVCVALGINISSGSDGQLAMPLISFIYFLSINKIVGVAFGGTSEKGNTIAKAKS